MRRIFLLVVSLITSNFAKDDIKERYARIKSVINEELDSFKNETRNTSLILGRDVQKSISTANMQHGQDTETHVNLVTLGGRKYYFSTKQHFSWTDTVNFCRLYGMELLSVETKEEDDWIVQHLIELGWHTATGVFMSGNNIAKSSYSWINGKPLTYTNWHPNNVKFSNDHNCLLYWHSKWASTPCFGTFQKFICEQTDFQTRI